MSSSDNNITKKRAVIYLRVSTNDQLKTDYDADGFSIRAQREACVRKATELGAVVVDEYVDRGESAKSADRPRLQEMLTRLRSEGDVDFVIVHKVDRLARSREDDMAIVIAIRKAGAQLVSATENIDETPQGKLLHGIMATIAEFYSANLATESKKGMLQKAKSGGTPNMAPLGYLNTRVRIDSGKEVRTVVVDPDRAHHITWAFEAYASDIWSMPELGRVLQDRGLTTRSGKQIHTSVVEGILKNPYYCGVVAYDGVEYQGRHTPLVDRETFERVQEIRVSRAMAREKVHKHPHYLKGSIFCGQCDDRLGVMNARGNGGLYPYFYCLGRSKRRTECNLRSVLIEDVERGVELLWRRVHLPEHRIAEIRAEASEQLDRVFALSREELARQQRRLAALEKQRDKARDAYYSEAMSLDEFRGEQRRINQEQAAAERIVGQCRVEEAALREAVEDALALLADAYELYQQASSMLRRQLNQAVFTKFKVHEGGNVTAELQAGFKALVEGCPREGTAEPRAVDGPLAEPDGNDEKVHGGLMLGQLVVVGAENMNRAHLDGRGSNYSYLVAATGIEPVTLGL